MVVTMAMVVATTLMADTMATGETVVGVMVIMVDSMMAATAAVIMGMGVVTGVVVTMVEVEATMVAVEAETVAVEPVMVVAAMVVVVGVMVEVGVMAVAVAMAAAEGIETIPHASSRGCKCYRSFCQFTDCKFCPAVVVCCILWFFALLNAGTLLMFK